MSTSLAAVMPSTRPLMGANAYSDPAGSGVTFRVWAPFASDVAVAGTFNGWSSTANPLASEGNGFWSADITEANTGDEYKFVVANSSAGNLWRMDPYVTRIIHNGGNLNGVIDTPSAVYNAPNYSIPAWDELVIYEMHIRTFVPGDGSIRNAVGESIRFVRRYLVHSVQHNDHARGGRNGGSMRRAH